MSIIKELICRDESIRTVFVGDGELRNRTEERVKCEGLGGSIVFAGAVDNVPEWLSAVDVLLMPSLFEGLPFVLVEAQAAGLPCVVSSSVSDEANISGKIHYISLEENPAVWADMVIAEVKNGRYNAMNQLVQSGYSIEETARKVIEAIGSASTKDNK